jgi:formylglycine-generating enzyme required for sulfatase activity
VDTDAPLPPAGGGATDDPATVAPLFDRLRIDFVPPGGDAPCAGCSNDFAANVDSFTKLSASAGFLPPSGQDGWTARVRLYVARFVGESGEPDAASTVDVTAILPAVGADGITDVTLFLGTDSVGVPIAPTPATRGTVSASQVGTWAGARRTPCATSPHSGEVCVPGGAFWMGDQGDHLVPGVAPGWRRLVVMSPFFLDAREVTAGRYRSSGLASGSTVLSWSGSSSGSSALDWCTFGPAGGPRDKLPMTCVLRPGAQAYCRKQGGDLPGEAQFEYAMSALRGQAFPWGNDLPACGDAIWGRLGFGVFRNTIPTDCSTSQAALGSMGGPEPPGAGTFDASDVLHLPDGDVWDLAGNVSEWAADWYQSYLEPCWSASGILSDPACSTPSSSGRSYPARGGGWDLGTSYLEAQHRIGVPVDYSPPSRGFRCARQDR